MVDMNSGGLGHRHIHKNFEDTFPHTHLHRLASIKMMLTNEKKKITCRFRCFERKKNACINWHRGVCSAEKDHNHHCCPAKNAHRGGGEGGKEMGVRASHTH